MIQTDPHKTTRLKSLGLLVSLLTFSLCPAGEALRAQDAPVPPAQEVPQPLELPETEVTFEYMIEGRPDPFMPFITEKATSNVNMDEIVDSDKKLTGMQLFEPGQLTLVALVKSEDSAFAMVEDFTGKGYIIEEGTLIGRRGVVTGIAPNRVIIEETAYTRAGKKLTSQIVMVLKKEGEE